MRCKAVRREEEKAFFLDSGFEKVPPAELPSLWYQILPLSPLPMSLQPLPSVRQTYGRENWNVSEFATQHNLGTPVSGELFKAQYED